MLKDAPNTEIPVNCPFMAQFHSPDNFAGNMRIDGNTGGKPVYFPNSYQARAPSTHTTPGFLPEAAEAPIQVGDLSRRGHYRHEAQPSEYDQVRELYTRVLTEAARNELHHNTARLLQVCPSHFYLGIVTY
jgi:catalase